MPVIFWFLLFGVSLILLIKSSDWLIESAEKIGLALGISPFIVGVTIVAIGTSFPELASSLAAVLKNEREIPIANAVGSNIANILLIIGISALLARILIIKRSLIDLDSPLLVLATAIFLFVAWDRKINFFEGLFLIGGFFIYLCYTIYHRREEKGTPEIEEVSPYFSEREIKKENKKELSLKSISSQRLKISLFVFLVLGMIGLALGANWTIESMKKISEILKIPASIIAITALAVGTSLPELVVSVRAAIRKKYEIALGNVFGSNVFNILLVTGIPSLITPLFVDEKTFSLGFPIMIVSTLLFVISGISRRIHVWEGAMYLLIYLIFVLKLCGFL